MNKHDIGVFGMGVMGKNLALNIADHDYEVAIYNRSSDKMLQVLEEHPDKTLFGYDRPEDFVDSLKKPRCIILMVQAGAATDAVIQSILPLLSSSDILIDFGNTYFKDTIRRSEELADSGIDFIGSGISGGELGARFGPAIFPGGRREAYERVAPIFQAIAAKADDGEPCVEYMGENGAGHYVKMVHNGIEYGDMQLIAESYDILRRVLGCHISEIADIFAQWNDGELSSYLIELTGQSLRKKDSRSEQYMAEVILDKAGNKGTGKWTSQEALDLGVPLSVITESVYARFVSAQKEERVAASELLSYTGRSDYDGDKAQLIEKIRQALFFSKIVSYTQGFVQMRYAAEAYDWDLKYDEIAKTFRAGCIIRAQFLQNIMDAYRKDPGLKNLLLDPFFGDIAARYQQSARDVIAIAVQAGIPVACFSAAIAYFDSYRSPRLPANIIQMQRDNFGAHTYERVDREGIYHFDWESEQETRMDQ